MSSHPGIKQIEFLVRGKLDERETQAVRLHLESCEQCRALYEDCRANEPVAVNLRKASEEQPTVRLGETISLPGGETHVPGGPAIPGYRIVRELHRGGQGVVYEAFQESPPRRVALKVMLGGPFAGQASRRRFEREVELAGNLKHPNIVAIHHSGVATGNYWFAMDYVEGQRLNTYLAGHSLSIEDRLKLFGKICDAVEYAHRRQVIHRDLKPSNILVDDQGEPRILDFGLARQVEPDERLEISLDGHVMGTLPYMSPEQARGDLQAIDTRTDVYSLGVVLYEMLTGKYPYDVAGSMRDVLDRIINTEPTPPSRVGQPDMESTSRSFVGRLRSISPLRRRSSSGIDSSVERIILRSLAKNPERRYPSVTDLAADVTRYLSGEPVVGPEDPWWLELWQSVVRHRVPVGIAAGFLVLLLGFGITASIQAKRNARLAEEKVDLAQSESVSRQRESAARQEAEEKKTQAIAAQKDAEQARDAERTLRELSRQKAWEAAWKSYVASFSAATLAMSTRNTSVSRACLDACPEDFRGWEWQYLNVEIDRSEVTCRGHSKPLLFAAFSRDSGLIITASTDGTTRLWDANRGRELGQLPAPCFRTGVSPDGKSILLMQGNDVVVWNTSKMRKLGPLHGHADLVTSASFSPDGEQILTASRDGTVRVWDTASRRQLMTIPKEDESFCFAEFSPDGRKISTGSLDHDYNEENTGPLRVRLWDTLTKQELITLGQSQDNITSVRFSPDGRTIVITSEARPARLLDATTGTELVVLPSNTRGVSSAIFSPDGRNLLINTSLYSTSTGDHLIQFNSNKTSTASPLIHPTFSPDGTQVAIVYKDHAVALYEVVSGACLTVFYGHTDSVNSVAFSPDGKRVVTASADKTAKVWGTCTQPGLSSSGYVSFEPAQSALWSPEGTRIVSAGKTTFATIWDPSTGREVCKLSGRKAYIHCAAWSPNDKWIVTAYVDGTVKLWDATTGAEAATFPRHTGYVYSVSFSHDSELIVTASGDMTAKVWSTRSREQSAELSGHTMLVVSAEFSPDGKRIVTSSPDGTTRIWDVVTGKELFSLPHGNPTRRFISQESAAFSPDGMRIVTTSWREPAKLWDATTGRELASLGGSHLEAYSAVFSHNGKRIVTTCTSGAKVWDAFSGREVANLDGRTAYLPWATFDAHDERIVTVGEHLKLWDAATGQELFTLENSHGVYRAVFSPDGKRIVATDNSQACVWDTRPYDQRHRDRRAALAATEKAKPLAQSLRDSLGDWAKVAEAIRNDQSVDEVFRRQALNLVLQSSSAELHGKTASQSSSQLAADDTTSQQFATRPSSRPSSSRPASQPVAWRSSSRSATRPATSQAKPQSKPSVPGWARGFLSLSKKEQGQSGAASADSSGAPPWILRGFVDWYVQASAEFFTLDKHQTKETRRLMIEAVNRFWPQYGAEMLSVLAEVSSLAGQSSPPTPEIAKRLASRTRPILDAIDKETRVSWAKLRQCLTTDRQRDAFDRGVRETQSHLEQIRQMLDRWSTGTVNAADFGITGWWYLATPMSTSRPASRSAPVTRRAASSTRAQTRPGP